MLDKVKALDQRKPVIISGDLNVAHQEIGYSKSKKIIKKQKQSHKSDLRNPDTNRNKTAGFTDQEREAFTQLLNAGFVDVWRRRNPKQTGAYTYWSVGLRKIQ
jgi:exonuclease III